MEITPARFEEQWKEQRRRDLGITDSQVDLTSAATVRLRRVSPGFIAVSTIDADTGRGTFTEHKNGKTVTSSFTFRLDGDTLVLLTPEPAEPADALVTAELSDYAAPDLWAAGIRALQEKGR